MKRSSWRAIARALLAAVGSAAIPVAAQPVQQWKFVSIIPAGQDVFMFVAAPLRSTGGLGSPLNPLTLA